MAQNATAVTLGEGTTTFAAGSRMFIVGQGGTTTLAASSTSATASNPWTTSGNVTARDCTIKMSVLTQSATATSPNVILDNCTVMMDTFGLELWLVNLTATRCTFIYTGTVNSGWGIYGNQTHDARIRTWILIDCVFMTQTPGTGYFLINAVDTATSSFANVRYTSADQTRGTYIELPFVDFVGSQYGDFFRTDFSGGLAGDHLIFTVTGSTNREDRDITTGFTLQPQADLTPIGAFNQDKYMAVDGNVNAWFPNMYLPNYNGNNLQLAYRQGSGGGTNGATIKLGHTWNPEFQNSDGVVINTPRLFWNDGTSRASNEFRVFRMPANKSNEPAANDVPAAATPGFSYGTANGLFLEEVDFTSTTSPGTGATIGTVNFGYIDKPIRVYDYATQVDAEIGQTITPKMPAAGTNLTDNTDTTVLVNEMTRTGTAIGYSSTDVRTFTSDGNIPAALTEAVAAAANDGTNTTAGLDFENWYGIFKQAYVAGDLRQTAEWPFTGSTGSVFQVNTDLILQFGPSGFIVNTPEIRIPNAAFNAIGNDSLKNTLRVVGGSRVQWETHAFPSGIILEGGVHDFGSTSGVLRDVTWTAGTNLTVEYGSLPAASTQQFDDLLGNLTVADGVVVALDSLRAITLQGSSAQLAMIDVSGSTATITLDPQEPAGINTITLDTTVAGFYAITANGAQTTGVTRFTAGSTVSHDFSSDDYAIGNPIVVYVKYDSDITTRTVYQETATTLPFQAGTTSREVGLPAPVATTLIEMMDTALDANIGLTPSLSTGSGLLNQTIINTDSADGLTIGQNQGQTVAASIANMQGYFTAWYEARALAVVSGFSGTDPMFRFLQGDVVQWDNRRITFSSGNLSAGFRVQHVVFNWESVGGQTFSLSRTGSTEVLPLVSGAASIGTVIAAIDASQTATQVGDIHNFNGRLAENPLLTEPAGGFETSGRYDVNIERT